MRQSRPPLVRMQYIDRQLRDKRYPNCNSMAGYFEVSSKSIQRDIEYMRDMLHAPIDYDPKQKGYFYTGEWALIPTALLDSKELEALQATRKVLSQYQGTPYHDEVSRAIDKLLQYLPVQGPLGNMFDVYSFGMPEASGASQCTFAMLEEAIRNKHKVLMVYHTASRQAESERVVHPYRLHYDPIQVTWYLVAWCELREETRTFAVKRIRNLRPTSFPFVLPDTFSISDYLDRTFDQVYVSREQEIRVRFTPYQSQWIREHRWHPTQVIEEHDDGSLIISFRVGALEAVKRWIMRYGTGAEVLAPQELRNLIHEELCAMTAIYNRTTRQP